MTFLIYFLCILPVAILITFINFSPLLETILVGITIFIAHKLSKSYKAKHAKDDNQSNDDNVDDEP